MKKKILILLAILLLLVSCSPEEEKEVYSEYEDQLDILSPKIDKPLIGVWKVEEVIDSREDVEFKEEYKTLYIDEAIFHFGNINIIDPVVTARSVDFETYLKSKSVAMPEKFEGMDKNVIIYKFSDDRYSSKDVIAISNKRIMLLNVGQIIIYDYSGEVDPEVTWNIYNDAVAQAEGDFSGQEENEFAVSLAFRRKLPSAGGSNIFNYEYLTYFIKKQKDDSRAEAMAVDNIVIPKESGLWTIEHKRTKQDENGISTDIVAANPTFMEEDLKTNKIEDAMYRRIDFVNEDFIATSKINMGADAAVENYDIFNIHNLSQKESLKITSIAGQDGLDSYMSVIKENINYIASLDDSGIVEYTPDPSNIGIKRVQFGWKFVSSIDAKIRADKTKRMFREFTLNIIPNINVQLLENQGISWRNVLDRTPAAIDASVSPDGKFIMIQTKNEIEIYHIYHGYISIQPLISIQNARGLEIVMVKWNNLEQFDKIKSEYDRLPRKNIQAIYPSN